MKIYAIERVDGGVEIIQCFGPTPQESIAKWPPERQAEITGLIREVSLADVQLDRTFRNAWKPDLTIDMVKAKAIAKSKVKTKDQEIDAATTPEELKAIMPIPLKAI